MICICANCHKLIHSNQFEKNLPQIFNTNTRQIIEENYRKISSNIKNFKFIKKNTLNPLEKIYGYGENWKKYLLNIHVLSVNKNNRFVRINELLESLHYRKKFK